MTQPVLKQYAPVQFSRIYALGAARGDLTVTNDDIAGPIDSSDEWIRQRTGIRQRHIANQKHHGCRVLKCRVNADGCIGCARATRNKTDTWSSCQLANCLSHIGRATFLSAINKLDFFGAVVNTV